MNLGSIYKRLGNLDQAIASTLKSLSSNLITLLPTSIWAASTKISAILMGRLPLLKSLELKPDNPCAHESGRDS